MMNLNYNSYAMKRKLRISLMVTTMIILFSCDYRETHVINTVHANGSVTRKVTVKTNTRNYLEPKTFDVPINNTWQIETSMEVHEENDTIWYLTAEKHFNSVDEINEEYRKDLGSNRGLQRRADFSKSFKWFTTVYRYSETIESSMTIDCPISDFLSDEALEFFYLPAKVQNDLRNGPDSLKFKELDNIFDVEGMRWFFTSEIRQWTEIFYDLFEDDPELEMNREEMRSMESKFVEHLMADESDREIDEYISDSLFISVLGEGFFTAFESEIDYAIALLHEMDKICLSAHDYDMEIRMPGRIIASNGYAQTEPDSENRGGILWTVDPAYILTQTYEMWAESKVNNYIVWIISALFVLFVITGFVTRLRKENT